MLPPVRKVVPATTIWRRRGVSKRTRAGTRPVVSDESKLRFEIWIVRSSAGGSTKIRAWSLTKMVPNE